MVYDHEEAVFSRKLDNYSYELTARVTASKHKSHLSSNQEESQHTNGEVDGKPPLYLKNYQPLMAAGKGKVSFI